MSRRLERTRHDAWAPSTTVAVKSEDLLSPEEPPRGAWNTPDSEPRGTNEVALPDRAQRWSHRQHLL